MASTYDKQPTVKIPAEHSNVWKTDDAIFRELKNRLAQSSSPHPVLTIDTYPGVHDDEILGALQSRFPGAEFIQTIDLKLAENSLLPRFERNLTDDRIFGVLSCHQLVEFFDHEKLNHARSNAKNFSGKLLIVYGVGAALVHRGDVYVFADMARWEIQLRYRKGMPNWGADNGSEDFFRKYKRSFFIEWRAADRHKFQHIGHVDYFLDTNQAGNPKMITGEAGRDGFAEAARQPFRVVPFFDPAPWGGQWMRQHCDLPADKPNYGWCFDCVPEENSLLLEIGDEKIEFPSLNVVYRHPVQLLGDKVHARFGCEFPIRFDFLDTMDGGHLSFQVHPLTEYIQQYFGMHYTQDESYYMLDAGDDACVYLGVKTGVDPDAMVNDLVTAQTDAAKPFPAEKHVNVWPAKKHDHFLIPAGTVHCSGKNSMVLEISATPYIFTFKMWDWGRLGLDGRPRPVHLQHGVPNIQWDRDTEWTKKNLINCFEQIAKGDGWREERTGLHEREFIETRRHWFTGTVPHDTCGGVNVLNLVEGEEAIVESPVGSFTPYVVHYAETFIVPASVGKYTIRPHGPAVGKQCATMKAFVRT